MSPELPEAFAAAFGFTRDLLRPPSEAQWAFLRSAETRRTWVDLCGRLGLRPPAALPETLAEYESAYIATFEAGAPHPPVPLIESHYVRREPVPRILHENILFYRAFGLRLRRESEETADHALHQLEFAAYLFSMEAEEARREGGAPERLEQMRRGRGEFLWRHLMSWVGPASAAARGCPHLYLRDMILLIEALVRTAAGAATPPPPSRETEGRA